MTDRIDPTTWPTPRGPWPQVEDLSRIYDHGRPWCINAIGHPGDTGYPDAGRHVPWDECHGPGATLTEVRDELSGDQVGLTSYMATPFRFGEQRRSTDPAPRLMIETASEHADLPTARISISIGEALRLARLINHLVDQVTMPATPARAG
jgi:hypothetical protein